jgi:hypothetical protein
MSLARSCACSAWRKTVADCFKSRNKIGLDSALEMLREAWSGMRVTMEELWRYAEIRRMENVMRPYLEAAGAARGDELRRIHSRAPPGPRTREEARLQFDADAIFSLERLVYRLSVSPWTDQFMLKGALLFVTLTEFWMAHAARCRWR